MDALAMVAVAGAVLLAGYLLYGRWLSRRLFELDDAHATPAVTQTDGRDYVPTKRSVLFGHHFTSIAGTGPIVGPAIAVMWGWLPALIWVLIGSVFIGAVHDLGALVVSLRNKGRSVGDIAGDLLHPRARLLFLCILIGALWIVLAIFGLVIATVLRQYPQAITPVVLQIPLALAIGVFIHRRGARIGLASIAALGVMYLSVVISGWGPLHGFNDAVAAAPMWAWVAGLLAYCYVASVLPVWLLLQPRDFINALQLVSCLVLIVLGLASAAFIGGPSMPALAETTGGDGRPELAIAAPMIDWQPTGAPPMLPVLFITVACGACSGFHCLVSSGTSSKQVRRETDAKPVGYGSMVTEALLAVLVIAACVAGLGLATQATTGDGPSTMRPLGTGADAGGLNSTFAAVALDDGNVIGFAMDWRDGESVANVSLRRMLATDSGIVGSDTLWAMESARLPIAIPTEGGAAVFDTSGRISLTGRLAFERQYTSWQSAGSLGAKVGAFVQGAANFIASLGVPINIAVALMAVMVASFAATTLDTSCRLQRYVVQELSRTFLPRRDAGRCERCGYDSRGHRGGDDEEERPAGAGADGSVAAVGRVPSSSIACPGCNATNTAADLASTPIRERRRAASRFNPFRYLATTHGATLFATVTAFALAMWPVGAGWPIDPTTRRPLPLFEGLQTLLEAGGSGGLILWPLFGATNQLLAGFAFVVITAWLIARRKPVWMIVPAAAVMLVVPAAAMAWQAFVGNADNPSWVANENWLLAGVASATLALEAWLLVEVGLRWRRGTPELIDAMRDAVGEAADG